MLFSCSFAMDSLNLSQLKSHFFRHNLISAEISHLVLFLWDFSKASNDSFDCWSDLRYHNCQVRLHPLKWTGISAWLFYSYLVWVNINPKWEASGYMGKQLTHPGQLPFHNAFEGRADVSSGLADVWITQIQGQVSYSFLVSTWSVHASQMPGCSGSVLCTSAKLHDFIHLTSVSEINILPGIVLGSGDTLMKWTDKRGSGEVW